MLVEGCCQNGHALVCAIRWGQLRGAVVRGGVRRQCPQCGAEVEVHLESGTLAVPRPSDSQNRIGDP